MSPQTRRLLSWFRPHAGSLAVAFVLILLHSAVPGALVLLVEQVLDKVLIARDASALAFMPLALVALYTLNGLLGFARGMLTRRVAWQVVTELRAALFQAIVRQDVGWHQLQPHGTLLARLTQDVENVQYGVSGVVTAIQKPVTLLFLVGAAASLDPVLTALALVAMPLVVWPIRVFGKQVREATGQTLDSLAHLSGYAGETLSGIRALKRAAAEPSREAGFGAENQRHMDLRMRAFAARLLPSPVIELIAAVGAGAVLWFGGMRVMDGHSEPGDLIAFILALTLVNGPLKGLAETHTLLQRALAGATSVFEILDRTPAIPDTGQLELAAAPADLTFDNISFGYGDGPVLRGVSLHVDAGKVVAVVGASGAGKSTLASLVSRLYDPDEGSVLINGTRVQDYRLQSLRSHVAVVSQEPFLFDTSVLENIRMARPNASTEEVQQAARVAAAHDFIESLPHGYETRLHRTGLRLSGGQRQRICIARAVLQRAPILILDEATSALDAASEAEVQQALDAAMKGRTVLIIAHRLSTIQHADEIIVLADGEIVERGDHASLLTRAGVYAALVRRQQQSMGSPTSV